MILSKCLNPIKVVGDDHIERYVPCGNCTSCMSLKAYRWKKRLDSEMSCHKFTLAFTLTYDNDHLPFVYVKASGSNRFEVVYTHLEIHPTYEVTKEVYDDLFSRYKVERDSSFLVPVICHYDLIDFIKKLKIYVPYIRWFIQSEIGPTTLRPHYHGLLFFSDYDPDFVKSCIFKVWDKSDWSLPMHQQSIHLADSSGYCTSYVASVQSLPKIHSFGRFAQFHYSSNRPPLGSGTFSKDELKEYVDGDVLEVVRYDVKKNGYITLPFLQALEDKFFPRLPNYSLLNTSARKFLLNAYFNFSFPRSKKEFDGKPLVSLRVFSSRFKRFLEDYPEVRDTVSLAVRSDSSINKIYYASRYYYESSLSSSKILVDYCYDAHYYKVEMAKLRQQYLYEENFCNERDKSCKFLIYKDPVFVSKWSISFGIVPSWVISTVRGYGFKDMDDFVSSFHLYSLKNNSDCIAYHQKIHSIIHESHKSKANNDYLNLPSYLKY